MGRVWIPGVLALTNISVQYTPVQYLISQKKNEFILKAYRFV